MTHILIPREPSPALLRPFVGCPQEELPQAYAAMIRIAEVERARAGSQCLAQIEEPAGAAPAAVAPQGEYPPLPEGVMFIEQIGGDVIARPTEYAYFKNARGVVHGAQLFTADQLRAYFDLGRQTEAPALEAPPAVTGRTAPRNDDERAAAQFFADNPGAALLAWPLYLARDKSLALEAPAAPACDEEAAYKKWFQGEQGKPYHTMWDFARAAWMARAALAAAPQAPAAPWKDHQTARLVNDLRDCAIKYHGAGQLRERIAHIVVPLCDQLKGALAAPAAPVAVPWDNFPAYLIDHCEGQTITEEGLQRALAAMLANPQYAAAAPAAPAVDAQPLIARNLAEWHEDDGDVAWWAWCGHGWAGEPAWIGRPTDDGWPGYHTHWTAHPAMPPAIAAQAKEGGA